MSHLSTGDVLSGGEEIWGGNFFFGTPVRSQGSHKGPRKSVEIVKSPVTIVVWPDQPSQN